MDGDYRNNRGIKPVIYDLTGVARRASLLLFTAQSFLEDAAAVVELYRQAVLEVIDNFLGEAGHIGSSPG
jgi:hypothetical protein